MKALLICLFVLLALFTSTEAARLKNRATNTKAATKTKTMQGGYNCFYYWNCYDVDIPGVGEEEVCDLVQKCF